MPPRPVGAVTRGTTNPNRLRRVDQWIIARFGDTLRAAPDPLVVDLGFGANPVTTAELWRRLSRVAGALRVIGLEIDPDRVAAAQPAARAPWLAFQRGGFELAGLRPNLVRALNVLRQYGEADVAAAWHTVTSALAPGGALIEGTCDELGRLGAWVLLEAGATAPRSLTLSADLAHLDRPAALAQRLPKALIHRNVPGEGIHRLLRDLDDGWLAEAPYARVSRRQRFARAVERLRRAGWPVQREPRDWRHGQLTVAWPAVAPTTSRRS